jgi:hypothetical protein
VVRGALAALLGKRQGAVPPALSLAVTLFSVLLPYRVLMVWVYDRTQSVLMAMLMRLPLVVCGFILISPAMAGVPDLVFSLVLGATLWVVVAAVTLLTDENSRERNTRVPRHPHALCEYVMRTGVSARSG